MRAFGLRAVACYALVGAGCNTLVGIDEPRAGADGSTDAEVAMTGDAPIDSPTSDEHDAGSEPTSDGEELDAFHDASSADARADSPDANDGAFVDAFSSDAGPSRIVFRNSSFATSRDDFISVRTPSFVAENDFLLLALYTDFNSTTVMAPVGWKFVADRPNAGNDFHSWWFYKFATPTEPAEYVFQLNQMTQSRAAVVVY